MVKAGLERLKSYQHDDGGWGWWPDDPSRVFMTAYVVSGLGQAKLAGYAVDADEGNKGRDLAAVGAGCASGYDSRSASVCGLRAGHDRRRTQRPSTRCGRAATS